MKEPRNSKNIIIVSILITMIFIALSMPNFIKKEKINHLLERIENVNFTNSDNKTNNNSNNNSNQNNSNNNSDSGTNGNTSNNDSNSEQNGNTSNNNSNSGANGNTSNNNSNSGANENTSNNNSNSEVNGNTSNNDSDSGTNGNTSNNDSNSGANENNSNPNTEITTKTFTATFVSNGSNNNDSTKSCQTTTGSCTVSAPTISSSKEVLGWSLNANATSQTYKVNESITLTSDITLYAITKSNVTVTVDGNGAFEGVQYLNCSYYNKSSSCSVTLPTLNQDYYKYVGYNTNKNDDEIIYNNGSAISVSNNLTVYGVRKIDTAEYDAYSSTASSIITKINNLRTSNGLNQLEYSKSLELTAMLRISEIAQNYDYNVNGDHHYRISNGLPFYSANDLAYAENYHRKTSCNADGFHNDFLNSIDHYENMVRSDLTIVGISINYIGGYCYIVELFG